MPKIVLTARRASDPIRIDVFANTPSEGELQRGDVIVAINGRDTTNLSHKLAQDAISAGGGQIEFLVQRPHGPVNIKPLSPTKDTRAPAFPQTPTRAPQINIPIQKLSGPQSPSRIIPISPQKPSPRPAAHPVVQSSHAYDDTDMSSGFKPKKITLNKYGGGGFDFGSSYGPAAGRGGSSPQRAPQSSGYKPVAAPAPMSPPTRGTIEYQTQFSAPQKSLSPQRSQEEAGVDSENLGGVGETRRNFMQKDPSLQHVLGDDENDYPTAPVWERRKKFGARGPPKQAAPRSRKPNPSFARKPPTDSTYSTFGVDYSKPQPTQQQPSKYATQKRERPPPVNRRDDDEVDTGTPWSNTLRPEGKHLKPWEREALEAERYQNAPSHEPYRPYGQPAPAPKPKIVQISTQSTAHQSGPKTPDTSTSYLPGPAPTNSKPAQQVPPGERNWNDSYLAQMVHSNDKRTHQGQGYGGQAYQAPQSQPYQAPAQQQQQQQPDYRFDATVGMSDF